jgi:zinc D-Ala-D-Ala carboxypeptidase
VNIEKLWNLRKKVIILFVLGFITSIYLVSHSLVRNARSGENVQNVQAIVSPVPTVQTAGSQQPKGDSATHTKLGHFSYQEANSNELIVISSYAQLDLQRFERLSNAAALALMKLIYAARDEGVWIVPVSGFRSVEDQAKLFQSQIQRKGSEESAAKISAPPGYSEHHTGYAVDVTDGHFPRKDTTLEFQSTDAFKWLVKHANEYGFEMSFSENNSQGVSYEPWHWRFIATQQAQAIFAPAH